MKRFVAYLAALGVLLLLAGIYFILYQTGDVALVFPDYSHYTVKGIDVSHHQGSINWKFLNKADIRFVYIKATEGKGYADPLFVQNLSDAKKSGIIPGAYLFFRFDRDGKKQAEYFKSIVQKDGSMLPPAIDVEFNGNGKYESVKDVKQNLSECLEILRDYYGKTPVIYTMYDAYKGLIQNSFTKYPIWMRDLLQEPHLPDGHGFVLCQFRENARVQGIDGWVDMNLFNGSEEDFLKFCSGK